MAAKKSVTKKPAGKANPRKKVGAKLFLVVHQVADLAAAAKGYAKLLGDPGRRIRHGGRHYFDVGAAILGLLDVALGGAAPEPSGSDLYLTVPGAELAGFHARAKALGWLSKADVHGQIAGEVSVKPWGERSFYVEDPWGNGLAFIDEKTRFTGK